MLRTLPYGDTSAIVRFLTPETGVLTVMARGVRSSRRKGASAPQLFSSGWVTVQIRENRDMHPLRDFAPDRVRLGLAGSLQRLAGAALLGDLVLRHSGHESQPDVAILMELDLDAIEVAEERGVGDLVLAQAWGLVTVLGYQPHLESCVGCERSFEVEELARFDFARGGVACSDCLGTGPRIGPIARTELVELVRYGARPPVAGAAGSGPPNVSRLTSHLRLLADFASYHVADGRRIAAFDYFLDTLPSQAPTPDASTEA